MSRTAALLAALLPGPAAAQAPDPIRIVDAKIEKDRLLWTETRVVPATEQVVVAVEVNGMVVNQVQTVTVLRQETVTRAAELKAVKATDAGGKAIPADKLADRLKELTPVVLTAGPVADKHRALFKDTVIFVEELPAAPPVPK